MSNANDVAMQQQQYSIVEYIGYNEGGSCGYCHREEASPTSIGISFCFILRTISVIFMIINLLRISYVSNF